MKLPKQRTPKELAFQRKLKRCFDIFLSIFAMLILFIPLLFLCICIKISAPKESVFYWSKRIGKFSRPFNMPKFRSMYSTAPEVATSLLQDPHSHLTPLGSFLRRSSLDELPQLWSILKGDMSFVGPRPSLESEVELNELREKYGVFDLTPGLTGWAQINGRDELSLTEKVQREAQYLKVQSFAFDLKIIWDTFWYVLHRKDISH